VIRYIDIPCANASVDQQAHCRGHCQSEDKQHPATATLCFDYQLFLNKSDAELSYDDTTNTRSTSASTEGKRIIPEHGAADKCMNLRQQYPCIIVGTLAVRHSSGG
jgi:hypothetical protein